MKGVVVIVLVPGEEGESGLVLISIAVPRALGLEGGLGSSGDGGFDGFSCFRCPDLPFDCFGGGRDALKAASEDVRGLCRRFVEEG